MRLKSGLIWREKKGVSEIVFKEIIFIPDRKNPDNSLHFRVNVNLWENIFSSVAFLAESGDNKTCVRFVKKEKGKGRLTI